jgi:hypothetical protein
MLTPVEGGDYGLGMGVDQRAGTSEAYFQHGGSNLGFKCNFFAHREAGYGVVIMTNGEHGAALGQEVFNAVAHADGWAGFSFAEVPALAESAEEARAAAGRYALPGPGTLELREADGHLLARHYPGPEHPLLRVATETWLDPETGRRFAIERGEGGLVEALEFSGGGPAGRARRLGPEEWPDEIEKLCTDRREELLLELRELHADSPADARVRDERLNDLALQLARGGEVESALAVARLDVEFHPGSSNAWDTIARLGELAGDPKAARQAYERVLATWKKDAGLSRLMRLVLPASARSWLADQP